jgi:hypothetical protein
METKKHGWEVASRLVFEQPKLVSRDSSILIYYSITVGVKWPKSSTIAIFKREVDNFLAF